MSDIKVLGIDLAKNIFQLHGVDSSGKTILKKRIKRETLAKVICQLPPCLIGMEACIGAHYWARKFIEFGHQVKLMNPAFVKPYVKSHKNDQNDAEGICEAVSRPNMRFVPVKTQGNQDILSIHRMRERLIKSRTALVNQIRGLLLEYGIVFKQQIQVIRNELIAVIDDPATPLSEISRRLFHGQYEELKLLDERIHSLEIELTQIFKQNESAQRLGTVPGIGLITATALIATIGNVQSFSSGRELSAFLGLVPRQASSGNKTTLLGISKRGDKYLRKLLVHGARAVVSRSKNHTLAIHKWTEKLWVERGFNKACVALANKNTRTVWALLAHNSSYQFAA